MQTDLVNHLQFIFVLLLIFIIAFGALADRLKIAYPIVLVIAGLLLSFIPHLPRISLDPNFIFLAVLPPLLFESASQTSWRDFHHNLVSILLLAFGLVGFTVFGVSFAAHWLIPGFDWRLGLLLGAAVAPTDAIAASAIARQVGLPSQITDLLEGESLVNDASGLLALEFSLAFIVRGEVPSFGGGALRLIYLVAAGIAIGWVIAKAVELCDAHLDDAPLEIAFTLVTPYIAYMAAEAAQASGVLAVVTAGLYLRRQSSSLLSPRVRIEAGSFWRTLAFLLNGIVFLLIGLELPLILSGIHSLSIRELLTSAAELAGSVIVLRLFWSFPGAYLSYFIRSRMLHQKLKRPGVRGVFVVGWTGMRGVVSLAAALSVPITLASGKPFPQRDQIIFLTFAVILVTLVLQGLTLPALIRWLHLAQRENVNPEETKARRAMITAALERLEELRIEPGADGTSAHETVARLYNRRLASLEKSEDSDPTSAGEWGQFRSLVTQLREVERHTVIAMRNRNEISDSVLHILERELDLIDLRFTSD